MFFAVCITSHGILMLVGKSHETREGVLEHFADAWASFNSTNHYMSHDAKSYGIAQIVDGVEMTQPPKFEIVPFMNLLDKPVGAVIDPAPQAEA